MTSNKRKQVNVLVSGPANSGKTCISSELIKLLNIKGFKNVTWIDEDDGVRLNKDMFSSDWAPTEDLVNQIDVNVTTLHSFKLAMHLPVVLSETIKQLDNILSSSSILNIEEGDGKKLQNLKTQLIAWGENHALSNIK